MTPWSTPINYQLIPLRRFPISPFFLPLSCWLLMFLHPENLKCQTQDQLVVGVLINIFGIGICLLFSVKWRVKQTTGITGSKNYFKAHLPQGIFIKVTESCKKYNFYIFTSKYFQNLVFLVSLFLYLY